jgi:hypothetical protein
MEICCDSNYNPEILTRYVQIRGVYLTLLGQKMRHVGQETKEEGGLSSEPSAV